MDRPRTIGHCVARARVNVEEKQLPTTLSKLITNRKQDCATFVVLASDTSSIGAWPRFATEHCSHGCAVAATCPFSTMCRGASVGRTDSGGARPVNARFLCRAAPTSRSANTTRYSSPLAAHSRPASSPSELHHCPVSVSDRRSSLTAYRVSLRFLVFQHPESQSARCGRQRRDINPVASQRLC